MNSHLRPVLLLLLLMVLMRKMTEPCHSLGCSSAVAELCGSTPARLVKPARLSVTAGGAGFLSQRRVFSADQGHTPSPVQKNLNDNSLSVGANQGAAPMTPAVSATLSH